LSANGFSQEDMSVFYVSPPGQNHTLPGGCDEYADAGSRFAQVTVLIGAGIGAVIGIAIGAALVTVVALSPVVAALAGGGVGAYAGSFIGALIGTRNAEKRPQRGADLGVRHSGVLLAVHVDEFSRETSASKILKSCGGLDVERANGQWRNGKWSDFDPVRSPVLTDKVSPRTAHH
ncbi:MAG TPA: hypothetical protein VFW00_05295, partial [Rhodocyclaceae bacterium]|nr:hypothetical protein [Rhodocyclaceae bacterium]